MGSTTKDLVGNKKRWVYSQAAASSFSCVESEVVIFVASILSRIVQHQRLKEWVVIGERVGYNQGVESGETADCNQGRA